MGYGKPSGLLGEGSRAARTPHRSRGGIRVDDWVQRRRERRRCLQCVERVRQQRTIIAVPNFGCAVANELRGVSLGRTRWGRRARACRMHARLRPTKSCLCAMLRRDDPRAVVHRCGAVRRLSIHALQRCFSGTRRSARSASSFVQIGRARTSCVLTLHLRVHGSCVHPRTTKPHRS